MRYDVLVAGLLLISCTSRDRPEEATARFETFAPASDSMVLRMPDSAEIWFTGSMVDTSSTGQFCDLRTIEIRRGGTRTPVPLLYTMGGLEVVDDTTVRAVLVRDCASRDSYLVSTRTGQPRRAQ
jgi:hypothetical protein